MHNKKHPYHKSNYHPLFLRSRPGLACAIFRLTKKEDKFRKDITASDFTKHPSMPLVNSVLTNDDLEELHDLCENENNDLNRNSDATTYVDHSALINDDF